MIVFLMAETGFFNLLFYEVFNPVQKLLILRKIKKKGSCICDQRLN